MRVLGGARTGLTAIATVVVLLALGARAAGDEGPDPSHLYEPVGLTVGSDRALWVADSLGVMRVTLDGRFVRALRSYGVRGITRGPDGAVWFTEAAGNKLTVFRADRHTGQVVVPSSDSPAPRALDARTS